MPGKRKRTAREPPSLMQTFADHGRKMDAATRPGRRSDPIKVESFSTQDQWGAPKSKDSTSEIASVISEGARALCERGGRFDKVVRLSNVFTQYYTLDKREKREFIGHTWVLKLHKVGEQVCLLVIDCSDKSDDYYKWKSVSYWKINNGIAKELLRKNIIGMMGMAQSPTRGEQRWFRGVGEPINSGVGVCRSYTDWYVIPAMNKGLFSPGTIKMLKIPHEQELTG